MSQIDKSAIKKDIESRKYEVNVTADWLTPSGRDRSFPMYVAYISNSYLGVSREIKAQYQPDVVQKAKEQLTKWAEQELRRRINDAKEDAQLRAEEMTSEAKERISAIEQILAVTLQKDDRIDWEALLDRSSYSPFTYETPPAKPGIPGMPSMPRASKLEFFLPPLRRKRLDREAVLRAQHSNCIESLESRHKADLNAYEKEKAQARAAWELEKATFESAQQRANDSVMEFRERYERGEVLAIEEYLRAVFERSEYPECFQVYREVAFDSATNTAVIEVNLPPFSNLPTEMGYRYIAKDREIKAVQMKAKDVEVLYDRAVKLTIIRTIHEVFESDTANHVLAVVVNGSVQDVDPATGQDRSSCVISVSTDRNTFDVINLARVEPTPLIRSLKGLVAGPLAQLGPVKPILRLDRRDSRFVQGRDILDTLDAGIDLGEMPWEEFEHLVRELFGKLFSSKDAEVRVTQASRDGGVDAIAFDPDPIRGGKFVIQAKRYTNVVPVSAVRDLYGTMINEGAVKGLLVTTSHYGRDAREFAKDKPISLIDGSNLVFLLREHGYNFKIGRN